MVLSLQSNYSLFGIFPIGPLLLVRLFSSSYYSLHGRTINPVLHRVLRDLCHKYGLMLRRWPLALLSIISNAMDSSREEQPEYIDKSNGKGLVLVLP